MTFPTPEQCEQAVNDALAQVREKFLNALEDRGEGGNVFDALEKRFHVDQARRVLTDVHEDHGMWIDLDGLRTLSVARRVNRGTLSIFVGSNRFICVDTVFMAFADIATGRKLRNSALIPGVFNLFAIEGLLFPDRDLTIRVTAARLLQANDETDLHAVLPPLSTEFDLLHGLLPAEAEPEYRLRPSEARNAQSWSGFRMQLLARVLPDVADDASQAASDAEADHLFQTQAPRLEQYVRDHLFARLASAIADADGHYVLLHPSEN